MSIRILTTSTLDSSPSVLVISPNGSKILVNCGEGCQRSFLESAQPGNSQVGGLKVKSIDRICLTHIGHDAIGGLCGFVLTSADIVSSATEDGVECRESLSLLGPKGLSDFCRSIRYFMKRDRFTLDVHEDHPYHLKCAENIVDSSSGRKNRGKKRKKIEAEAESTAQNNFFGIHSIPMKRKVFTLQKEEVEIPILSYIFSTQKIPGKFQIEKAKALKIPPGPLYAKLKHGKSVTFMSENKLVTVDPLQVLEGGSEGISFAIIYCPDEFVLDQFYSQDNIALKLLDEYKPIESNDINGKELEIIVHLSPKYLFESTKYQQWMRQFGPKTKHMTLYTMEGFQIDSGNEDLDGSPFQSAVKGAMMRSLIDDIIYPNPYPSIMKEFSEQKSADNQNLVTKDTDVENIIHARPNMEYILTPLKNKGINLHSVLPMNSTLGITVEDVASLEEQANKSGALAIAKGIITNHAEFSDQEAISIDGEILFTGTGSALPCKHRNVTGIYIKCKVKDSSMILDAGEGTTGQLLRAWSRNLTQAEVEARVKGIKAVFISHPHADHHLGIVRLLSERNNLMNQINSEDDDQGGQKSHHDDRIILMAPQNIIRFLDEYSNLDPAIRGSYIPVDCQDMLSDKEHPLGNRLYQSLGIEWCASVPVTHCAWAYAIVIDGTAFGRLVYSGDCRPSERLTSIGKFANILIHEATFEDGKENEAKAKKHSTVGEAICVGKKMQAKAIVLTHFSQRYHRIPPCSQLGQSCDETKSEVPPIVFAFDFMTLKPNNIQLSSKLTSAMQKLYLGVDDDDGEKATTIT